MLKDNRAAPTTDRKTSTMLCQVVGTEQFVKVNIRKECERPIEPFLVQVDPSEDGKHTWLRNSAIGIVTPHEAQWFSAQNFSGLEHNGKLYMQLEPVVEVMPTAAELARAKSVIL